MNNTNVVILSGRITKELEAQTVGNTSKVVISIANNRSMKKGENWEDDTSFFDVTCWGSLATFAVKTCHKGMPVNIVARLHQDRWEKDGQKNQRLSLTADSVEPIYTGKKDSSAPAETSNNDSSDFIW